MNRLLKVAAVIMLLSCALLFHTPGTQAQTAPAAAASQPLITNARVDMGENQVTGSVYVTIGGTEKKIADQGLETWIIRGGRQVVYSGRDGSGGFEDEGQSLRVYDARTGKTTKVMSEYTMVDTVTEVTTSTNKTALLVKLADGGLGASYLAVVDPDRGEVFYRNWAKIISREGDTIVVGFYKEDDWDKFLENENANVTPYKTERHNLNKILKRRVIYNKPDRPD